MADSADVVFVDADDDGDVIYVGSDNPESSRQSVESGVFDLDPPVARVSESTNKHRRNTSQAKINEYFVSSNSHIQRERERNSQVSAAKRPKDRPDTPQRTLDGQLQRVNSVTAAQASLINIVRLAASNGQSFNAEKLLVLRKLCEGECMCVIGNPGTAKTHTLAYALDELPDTWVFSNAGIAASNLLESYAQQRGLDVKTAREILREKNVIIKHYDSFFAILPEFNTYQDWERNTMRFTLAKLLDHFRRPPKRIVFEEACNIPSDKYDIINRICNRMAKEVHEERICTGAPDRSYIPRYMAVDTICYFGDPKQLVPVDPVTRQPDRLMDSAAFNAIIDDKKKYALTKIERQDDPVFQKVVCLIGDGIINDEVQLFMRTLKVIPAPTPEDGVVITAYKAHARQENDRIIDSISVQAPDEDAGRIRSYAVVCQYDTLADTRVRRREANGEDAEARSKKHDWANITPEENSVLFEKVLLHGRHSREGNSKNSLKELVRPTRLKFGTLCIYGTNHKMFEHLNNGTRVIIVGWTKTKNMPIVSLESVAEEYKEEHGIYGYNPEGLKTGETVVVNYTTSRFRINLPKTAATATTPAVPGKSYSCKRVEMKLQPAYAFTAHKVQGKSIDRTVIDPTPSRQFADGLFFVAMTRSRQRPALLCEIPPNFTVKVDRKAIEECKKIEQNMRNLCEENNIPWDL